MTYVCSACGAEIQPDPMHEGTWYCECTQARAWDDAHIVFGVPRTDDDVGDELGEVTDDDIQDS